MAKRGGAPIVWGIDLGRRVLANPRHGYRCVRNRSVCIVQQVRDLVFVQALAATNILAVAVSERVGPAEAYDIGLNANHNFLSASGYEVLLSLVLRICPLGILWLAPDSASWFPSGCLGVVGFNQPAGRISLAY
jgi:hypothetical protein